ncbi:MAG: DUF2852 domain-containing protein [Alphaproteobacteria bacterium]|nr:DUF2852 domain-containing protein [Alphaproteobacteria bacterium]
MNTQSYAYAEGGERQRFSGWQRAERKPWSVYEIGAVIGGFAIFWPLGLVALYLKHRKGEIWKGASDMQAPWSTWKSPQDAAEAVSGCCSSWKRGWQSKSWQGFVPTGNHAFDEYRKAKLDELEALRRKLDEERAAFDEFLAKLRKAKDREDFERFMAEKNAPKTQD